MLRPSASEAGDLPARDPRSKVLSLLAVVFLVGVPLLVLYALARENVSGRATRGRILTVQTHWPTGEVPWRVESVRLFSTEELVREMRVRLRDEHLFVLSGVLTSLVGQPTETNPPLASIEVRFASRDDPYDLLSADDTEFWLTSAATGAGGESNRQKLETKLYSDGYRTVWLGPSGKGATLPAHLDRFTLEFSKGQVFPNDERHLHVLVSDQANVVRAALGSAAEGPDPLLPWLKPPDWLQWLAGVHARPRSLAEEDQFFRLRILWGSFWLLVVLGTFVSLNWTSMHGFYRDRLRETYVESLPSRGRNIPMSSVDNAKQGAPYLLISGTLNLLGAYRSEDRTWPFLFSRLYCGSFVTGYVPTGSYLREYDDLAEVAAISGAAVSPAQADGVPPLLLMALANVRLGQWLPHPKRSRPSWWDWPALLSLAFGFLFEAEDRRRCFVTDGGHNENLGLWPLLQRRCKLILVSDAGQDPEHIFDDFLKVCRRARLYHGVQVFDLHDDRPIDLKPLRPQPDDRTCAYHFFVGRVRYPNNFMRTGGADPDGHEDGYIIYLKPSLTNDEENDLLRHFRHRRPFPDDPTLNQVFDEDTVESYRQLGFHIGQTLGRAIPADELWADGQRYTVEQLIRNFLLPGLHSADPKPVATG